MEPILFQIKNRLSRYFDVDVDWNDSCNSTDFVSDIIDDARSNHFGIISLSSSSTGSTSFETDSES